VTSSPPIQGRCTALFAFDLGFAIDLQLASRLLSASDGREPHRAELGPGSKASKALAQNSPPLCAGCECPSLAIAGFPTMPGATAALYDFGVVSISIEIPLNTTLDGLLPLARELYENQALLAASRLVVQDLLGVIRPAVSKPSLASVVEDYMIYQLTEPRQDLAGFVQKYRPKLAQALRSEHLALSDQETDDALATQVSYTPGDIAIVDWNAALLMGEDLDDARAVLAFANVELLELRFLDEQLDRSLTAAYEAVQRPRCLTDLLSHRTASDLRRISSFQVDAALLFEGVNNALKLLGDQYLARLYRSAGQRFHLPDWDQSILRKLATLESIYDKIADRQGTRRMELLEWIVIVLIAFEIVMSILRAG